MNVYVLLLNVQSVIVWSLEFEMTCAISRFRRSLCAETYASCN